MRCKGHRGDPGRCLDLGARQPGRHYLAYGDRAGGGEAEVFQPGVLCQLLLTQGPEAVQVGSLGLVLLLFAAGGVHQQFPTGSTHRLGGPYGDSALSPHHGAHVFIVGDALGVHQACQVAVVGGIPGIGVQLGAVQLEQQLLCAGGEPEPEPQVQFLAHLLDDAEQAAGLDLAGVGVGKAGLLAQGQARPVHGLHQLPQGGLHPKALEGLGVHSLCQQAGSILAAQHQPMVCQPGRENPHEPIGATQPQIAVRAAQRLQSGGGLQLQLSPLDVGIKVIPLRPHQGHPAFDAAQQLQPTAVDTEALVAGGGQGTALGHLVSSITSVAKAGQKLRVRYSFSAPASAVRCQGWVPWGRVHRVDCSSNSPKPLTAWPLMIC